MFRKITLLLIVVISSHQLIAQQKENRKKIKTTRVKLAPKIDGFLEDNS